MIIKSLSRSSNGSQLLQYVFRYIGKEEKVREVKTPTAHEPFSREHIQAILEKFKDGNLNIDLQPDTAIARELAEQELDTALRITKATTLAKDFIQREKVAGRDLKGATLHLTANHLIVRSKSIEQFFKLSHPTLFSSIQQPAKAKEPSFIIRHNVRARSIKEYIREFEKVEALRAHRRSDSPSIYHTILSFGAKDKEHITDAMLKDLAKKFIELRGPDNLYVGTKHTDKDHIHLHLVMSAADLAGRSVRISKSKFQSLKQELDRYQQEKYPELSHSLPEHSKKQRVTIKEAIEKNIKNRTTEKASLLQILESTFSKATSKENFLSQLKEQGYEPYYRSGTLTGVTTDDGRKFRLARLGYDQQKLAALDLAKEIAEKELAEIRSLRELNTRSRSNERLAAFNALQSESLVPDKTPEEIQSGRGDNDTDRSISDDRDSEARQSDSERGNDRSDDDTDQNGNDNRSASQELDCLER